LFHADFLNGEDLEIPLPDSRVTKIGKTTDGALPAEVAQIVMQLLVTATERASRRIDLKALAEANKTIAPDIDLSAILTK